MPDLVVMTQEQLDALLAETTERAALAALSVDREAHRLASRQYQQRHRAEIAARRRAAYASLTAEELDALRKEVRERNRARYQGDPEYRARLLERQRRKVADDAEYRARLNARRRELRAARKAAADS